MPQEPKKPWIEPELIAIVRNNPEEAVLGFCKSFPNAGPVGGFTDCFEGSDSRGPCTYCTNDSFS